MENIQFPVARGCGRLEWWCLDWNQPSIDFYKSLGAEPMDEWTTYRITGETLRKMGIQAEEDESYDVKRTIKGESYVSGR